eukprot:11497894-Prorocentrum_lima.AAC.1
MVKYIEDIQPVSDRIVRLQLRSVLPVTFLGVYAPTAQRSEGEKERFYEELQTLTHRFARRGPTFILGDFNARLQTRLEEEHDMIGPHVFDPTRITIAEQLPETLYNRHLMLDYLIAEELRVMNTFFPKPVSKLVTYRELWADSGPPYERGRYETLDYVLAPQRWRNCVRDVTNDLLCNVFTPHYPLIARLDIRLKALQKPATTQRLRLAHLTTQQVQQFQEHARELISSSSQNNTDVDSLLAQLNTWALQNLPQIALNKRLDPITPEFREILEQRQAAIDLHDDQA